MWRPGGEAEATSNMAVFVEWLRATGRRPLASPDDVRLWRQREPDACLAAVADFAGTADRDLLSALAEHLLTAETRPGDVLAWHGDPGDPWPRAARALGATVVLTPGGAAPDARETPPRSSR